MHRSRALAAFALAPALLLGLAACADDPSLVAVDATAGPAGDTTSTATSSPDPQPSASSPDGEGPTGSDSGCAPGGEIPANATGAEVGDLDGDDARDEVWLANDGGQRLLGVRTASGKVMSIAYEPGSKTASAVGNRLGDGSAIILLNTGDSAALYAVVDCEIVPTENAQGQHYEFDLGAGSYGTGVACPQANDKLYLAGYLGKASERDGYEFITRTRIDLSEAGAQAANGTVADLGEYSTSSASSKIAHGVACGDSGTAEEPPA